MSSEEFKSNSEQKRLLSANCKIEKIHPPVFGSDAEVNIVTVTVLCPDGKTQNPSFEGRYYTIHDNNNTTNNTVKNLKAVVIFTENLVRIVG
jgi:hypothetical protein